MKQLLFIIILLISTTNWAINDPIGEISGSVIDAELQEPIPFASIIVNDLEGNLVSGNTSDENGLFTINSIPSGDYIFNIQFMGYKTYSRELNISGNNSQVNLGQIELEPDVAMLDEVNLVAERTTIEQRVDRKVINIGKDLTTTGASASDIMRNLPSISVDQDGNIALRGNPNVRILIDGKPSNMDPAQLLKQIPSSSIKQVELITNPSAKYNPEGMSGIINIILHKNANNGFNGNLNTGLTVGKQTRYNGSLNLNYRKDKFNFYGNVGANLGNYTNSGRIFLIEQNARQQFDLVNHNDSYLYKVGVDYYLNDNNTLSFYTNQNHYKGGPEGSFKIEEFNNPENNFTQGLDMNFNNHNASYNLAFKRDFEKEGHELQIEADLNEYTEEENSSFDLIAGDLDMPSYSEFVDQSRQSFIGNIDYTNPLSETSKLEIGAETRLLETDNHLMSGREDVDDSEYRYNRDIHSFYTTFSQNFDKWAYQLGARFESFETSAILDGSEVFSDDYLTVYPSGFLSFNPDEKNTYQLSYSRRVDRPGLGQVSPIREVSNPRLTVIGNPRLKPQFTNSLELNYTRSLEKGSLSAGVFYRNINDEMNQVFMQDPNNPTGLILTYDNYEDNNAYGAEISGNYKFTSWWSTNTSAEVYNQTQKGGVGDQILEIENSTFNIRSSHSFNLSEALTFQAFGFYRGKARELQMDIKPMYFVNLGTRYQFWDDRASLSLNFNDVFNTQEARIYNGRPFNQESRFKGDSQTVYLGFSYRFGGSGNKALQRKNQDKDQDNGGGLF